MERVGILLFGLDCAGISAPVACPERESARSPTASRCRSDPPAPEGALVRGLWEMLGEQFATRTDAELAMLADVVTESVTALDRAREGLRGKP
ncbi:MAG: hypothetical protein HOQ44_14195 [Nocardia sp.]|nr:hypothetical protein [Nocardia sp.]